MLKLSDRDVEAATIEDAEDNILETNIRKF
jgi:hypothetical protein